MVFHVKRINDFVTLFMVLILSWTTAIGQAQEDDVAKKIVGLTDEAKVEYVLEHFREINSVSPPEALDLTAMAAEIAHQHKWKESEGHCVLDEGIVSFLSGDYDKVLPLYFEAGNLFDSLHNDNGLARLNNELADFYSQRLDSANVTKCLDAAETYSRKANNLDELARALGARATNLLRAKKIDEAEHYFREVYDLRVQQNDKAGIAYALLDFSLVAQEKGDLKSALEFIQQSTAIRKEIGDAKGIVSNLINTGNAYRSIGEHQQAIPYFKESLAKADSLGYTDLVLDAYEQLALNYSKANDFQSAFHYQQKSHQLKDSLANINKLKMIEALQTKYENEKNVLSLAERREKVALNEIALQNSHLKVIVLVAAAIFLIMLGVLIFQHQRAKGRKLQQENDFETTLTEIRAKNELQQDRLRISRELYDHIGSKLLFISTAADTLKGKVYGDSSEKVLQMGSFAKVTLDELRRTVWLINRDEVSFDDLQQKMKEYFTFLKQMTDIPIHVAFEADGDLMLRSSIAAVIFRIIQESISNAITHGQPSDIDIRLSTHADGGIRLFIHDNGKGYDTGIPMLGNGIKNMKAHAGLAHGVLEIASTKGVGTDITLSLPG